MCITRAAGALVLGCSSRDMGKSVATHVLQPNAEIDDDGQA